MSSSEQPSADVKVTGKGRPVPKAKLDQVSRLVTMLEKYEYTSLLRVEQIGSRQLQAIKKALRSKAVIHMARNSLMTRALELAAAKKKGLDQLIRFVDGSCAFAFTDISPFELNDLLKENKAKAPAKAGTVSSIDIIIAAGNTGFPPGPLISELGQVGLKTRIQGGSIWITKDHIIVKTGDTVTRPQALVMSRLGMEPYDMFLRIIAAYDDGIIITSDVFDIAMSDVLGMLQQAGSESFALAIALNLLTPDTVPLLIQQAHHEAQSLALFAAILTDETTGRILAQAEQEASALAAAVRDKDPKVLPN